MVLSGPSISTLQLNKLCSNFLLQTVKIWHDVCVILYAGFALLKCLRPEDLCALYGPKKNVLKYMSLYVSKLVFEYRHGKYRYTLYNLRWVDASKNRPWCIIILSQKSALYCTVGSNDYYRSLCIKLFWIALNILKLVSKKNWNI